MNDQGKSNGKIDGTTDSDEPHRLSESLDDTGGSRPIEPNKASASISPEKLEELEKFKSDYLYLRAEFENFKKNTIKERSDLRKYGCERFAADLLNVLDIFDTALATDVTPESVANFRKGIEMTAGELRNVMNRHGVTEIPSHGQPFDPAMHEALSSEESADVAPGTVTRVFKKAYKLHDRVIRPGQVVVAKAKS